MPPTTTHHQSDSAAERHDVEVLLTGFGVFSTFLENPSWLAVSQLHGQVLKLTDGRQARIQCVQIPVVYSAILDTLPRIHGHAPQASLVASHDAAPWLDPQGEQGGFAGDGRSFPEGYSHLRVPEGGFDVVLHVGVGREGPMRIETRARKSGYRIKDQRDTFAPRVGSSSSSSAEQEESEAQRFEARRMQEAQQLKEQAAAAAATQATTKPPPAHRTSSRFDAPDAPPRGFPESAYPDSEGFISELRPASIDTQALCEHLNKLFDPIAAPKPTPAPTAKPSTAVPDANGASGDATSERLIPAVELSTDAGLFLCEYIYYASLAESRRRQRPAGQDERQETSVLFLHCPPIAKPFEPKHVSAIVREAVAFICERRARRG